MREHDCGCKTDWSDELDHPMYERACSQHKRLVPDGWMVKKKSVREMVEANA